MRSAIDVDEMSETDIMAPRKPAKEKFLFICPLWKGPGEIASSYVTASDSAAANKMDQRDLGNRAGVAEICLPCAGRNWLTFACHPLKSEPCQPMG